MWHLFFTEMYTLQLSPGNKQDLKKVHIKKTATIYRCIFSTLFFPKKTMRQLATVRGWNRSERFRFGLSHRREVRRRVGRSPSLAQACGRGSLWTRAWHPSATSGRGGHTSSTGCDSAKWLESNKTGWICLGFQPVAKWQEKWRHWKLVTRTVVCHGFYHPIPGVVRCASFHRRDWLGDILNPFGMSEPEHYTNGRKIAFPDHIVLQECSRCYSF